MSESGQHYSLAAKLRFNCTNNMDEYEYECAFGVPAGNLLGFIVSIRGIELDPSKIKAIQKLPPPKTEKE